jgi:hypothetical protein
MLYSSKSDDCEKPCLRICPPDTFYTFAPPIRGDKGWCIPICPPEPCPPVDDNVCCTLTVFSDPEPLPHEEPNVPQTVNFLTTAGAFIAYCGNLAIVTFKTAISLEQYNWMADPIEPGDFNFGFDFTECYDGEAFNGYATLIVMVDENDPTTWLTYPIQLRMGSPPTGSNFFFVRATPLTPLPQLPVEFDGIVLIGQMTLTIPTTTTSRSAMMVQVQTQTRRNRKSRQVRENRHQ